MRVKPSPILIAAWPERFKDSMRGTWRLSKYEEMEVRWDGEADYSWYSTREIEEVDE